MTGLLEQAKSVPTTGSPPVATQPVRHVGPPPPGEQPALLIEHLTKRFVVGRKKKTVIAVNDVSLRIERGEIYGVLGANGSGKSTLIRLVSTLLTLDEGRVEVFGHDIERDEMAVKRLINRVSVDAAFFKKLSPAENLIYAARLYGLDARYGTQRGDPDPGPAGHRRVAPGPAARADEPGHAAEGRHRAGPPDEPDPAAAGRADHRVSTRARSSRCRPSSRSSATARRDDRADHARPRRGRAAVRSDRDPQRRPAGRRGHAGELKALVGRRSTAQEPTMETCS